MRNFRDRSQDENQFTDRFSTLISSFRNFEGNLNSISISDNTLNQKLDVILDRANDVNHLLKDFLQQNRYKLLSKDETKILTRSIHNFINLLLNVSRKASRPGKIVLKIKETHMLIKDSDWTKGFFQGFERKKTIKIAEDIIRNIKITDDESEGNTKEKDDKKDYYDDFLLDTDELNKEKALLNAIDEEVNEEIFAIKEDEQFVSVLSSLAQAHIESVNQINTFATQEYSDDSAIVIISKVIASIDPMNSLINQHIPVISDRYKKYNEKVGSIGQAKQSLLVQISNEDAVQLENYFSNYSNYQRDFWKIIVNEVADCRFIKNNLDAQSMMMNDYLKNYAEKGLKSKEKFEEMLANMNESHEKEKKSISNVKDYLKNAKDIEIEEASVMMKDLIRKDVPQAIRKNTIFRNKIRNIGNFKLKTKDSEISVDLHELVQRINGENGKELIISYVANRDFSRWLRLADPAFSETLARLEEKKDVDAVIAALTEYDKKN